MKRPINQDKSSADILLEAIQDMHTQEQIVTRETLAANAGLADMTKTQIDDRLAYLENNGRIVRVQRGVYVPAEQHKPARHVSRSLLPDGTSRVTVPTAFINSAINTPNTTVIAALTRQNAIERPTTAQVCGSVNRRV